MSTNHLSPGQLAQIACILEATARKPGNIHRFRDFADTHLLDFLLSASAIAGPLDQARSLGVGPTILRAVESTRRVVATNTNLGMILLLTPLAAVPEGIDLEPGVGSVLASLTINDARHAYQAIRLARPGGLGSAPEQDVFEEPTVSLLDAMRLASVRDLIARQYMNHYSDIFTLAMPALDSSLSTGRPLETAIIFVYLTLLAHQPDTLIARKLGPSIAAEATRLASAILAAGWPDRGRDLLEKFDEWLCADGHSRNPGATADLVATTLFAALKKGTIELPRPAGPAGWTG